MDLVLFWRSISAFNFLFLILWTMFYTYQPNFMKDSDFVGPGSTTRGSSDNNTKDKSDKYLSDAGRSLVFLSSLLISLSVIIVGVALNLYFTTRRTIKCKKGAKSIKECELTHL